MAIITSQGFQLTPDFNPFVQTVRQSIQRRKEEQRLQEIEQAEKLQQILKTTGAQFLRLRGLDDFKKQRTELAIMARNAVGRGEDTTLFDEGMAIQDKDALNTFFTRVATRAVDADKILNKAFGAGSRSATKPFAPVTLVNSETKEKILMIPTFNLNTGGTALSNLEIPEGFEISKETAEERRAADAAASAGITQATEDIKTAEIIEREAKKAGIEAETRPQLEADIAKAKDAVKKADQLFEAAEKIQTNTANLREARQALLAGAGTGPIERLWPSFRAASVRLDNLQGRLGLDVVGATTFGALSKGELDLSKAVALPTGLSEEELGAWIDRRIAAQEAKAEYLLRQAIFLSEKDVNGKQSTKADWARSEREALDIALETLGVTEADIKETMRANGMDRTQVLREIRRRFESAGT